MDKNVKNALIIIAAVFIGLALFRLGQWYFIKHQVESAAIELQQGLDRSMKETQQRLAAAQRERERQSRARQAELQRQRQLKEQREFEANLLCAANADTGKCTCYDRRTNQPVKLTLEQCRDYVDQQRSRY
jgi:hypothetical protein